MKVGTALRTWLRSRKFSQQRYLTDYHTAHGPQMIFPAFTFVLIFITVLLSLTINLSTINLSEVPWRSLCGNVGTGPALGDGVARQSDYRRNRHGNNGREDHFSYEVHVFNLLVFSAG